MSTKYTVLMLPECQNEHKKAASRSLPIPRVIGARMFGCSRVNGNSLMRWFEQTGISINAQDQCNVRKQRQDKTINLHSHIDLSRSSRQL